MADYEAFEDVEQEWYGPVEIPATVRMGYQVRQVGVGGASTTGFPPNLLGALANPPANMVAAAAKVQTTNVYTENDLGRYFPSSEFMVNTDGGTDGGTP